MKLPVQGRPRDANTTERIIRAATTQVLTGGLQSLNYEALATAAKTSRASIYRRWPTKLDLGVEVMGQIAAIGTKPDSGDLIADLAEHCLQTISNHSSASPAPNPADIWASIAHRDLAKIYEQRIGKYRRQDGLEIIAAGISRGELPENVDANLILDTMAGYVTYLTLYSDRQVSYDRVVVLARSLCANPPLLPKQLDS